MGIHIFGITAQIRLEVIPLFYHLFATVIPH